MCSLVITSNQTKNNVWTDFLKAIGHFILLVYCIIDVSISFDAEHGNLFILQEN